MRWERFNPLAGVVAVVLWILGTYLLEKTDRPSGKSSEAMAAWVAANDTSILAGALVFGFGGLFFVWFLGALRARLLEAEGGPGRWRRRVLPRWFTWITLLLALVLVIVPIGRAGLYVGLPLWTLITSIVLFRAERPTARTAPES